MLIVLAFGAILIFMMFSGRRRQQAQQREMASKLAPGSAIMTSFGLFGTVVDIDEENNQVTIESGPGTLLRVHRQTLAQVEAPAAGAAAADSSDSATSSEADPYAADAAPESEVRDTRSIDEQLDAYNEARRAERADDLSADRGDYDDPDGEDRPRA